MFFFYLLPAALLHIPFVQQKISHIASVQLKEKLGTEVNIGSVEFELLNKIVLKNIFLEDQSGDTLFHAQRLSAGFEFLPLFKGKLIFASAQLFTFQLNLNKVDDDSPLNLQFVIDAFASKDTIKKTPNINLNIQTLNIRRGNITYHVKSEPETSGRFNAKHLDIANFSAKIHLYKLTNDSINASISNWMMKEKSGLEIKRLLLDIEGTDKKVKMDNFELWLPGSHFQLKNAIAMLPEEKTPDSYILNTLFFLDIAQSEFSPKDFSALAPDFVHFKDKLTLKGHIEGSYNDIHISDFIMFDANRLYLQANLNISDLSSPGLVRLNGNVKRFFISSEGISRMANNFSAQRITFPEQIQKLGNIDFTGKISGYIRDLKAFGNFSSGCGDLHLNVNLGTNKQNVFFLKGAIETSEFDIHPLFGEKNPYGKIAFKIELDAKHDTSKKLAGLINADVKSFEFNNHTYQNMQFKGDFTSKDFKGHIDIDDLYGKIVADGFFKVDNKKIDFDFLARVSDLKLDKLNLTNKYKDSKLSFVTIADITGTSIDNLLGYITLKDFDFQVPGDSFTLDSLIVHSSGFEGDRLLTVQSDIINGDLSGNFNYSNILPVILQTMYRYMPEIIPVPQKLPPTGNNFQLNLTVENTEKLSKIFALPVTIYQKSSLNSKYNQDTGQLDVDVSLPRYNIGGTKMEQTSLSFRSLEEKARLNINGIRYGKFDVKTDFNMDLSVKDNLLESLFQWKNREKALYEGKIAASTLFSKSEQNSPLVEIDLHPSYLTFNDTIWTVSPTKIMIDEKIKVNLLEVKSFDQFVKINGVVSKDTTDNLFLDLNKVNLSYIFDALTIANLDLGGIATGKAIINDVYHTQKLTANLFVERFSFNNAPLGDLRLSASWDPEKQGISMIGNVFKNDTSGVGVNGMIYPVKKELSFYFDARNANGSFLRKYLDKVAPGFSGDISGKLHLHGEFKDVTVEGNAFVKNGKFGIDFLNTYYTFSDSVYLTDEQISIKNTILHDKFGRKAIANGALKHKFFDTFNFSINVNADNFLVYNASERHNPSFYGTAFGTGNVSLFGTENDININVSLRTNDKTKIALNFMNPSDVIDFDFIQFETKTDTLKTKRIIEPDKNKVENTTKSNVKLNLVLDATPDALVEFYVDPISGDKIKAWGKGKMQIQYGTNIEPKIYGNYMLDRGTYHFSLQQVIFKDFRIEEGSSISFSGDPYEANLDINAIYSLQANPGDLDNSFNVDPQTPMSTVMVNCLLNIAGELQHPTIKFDLKLPHSSSELERQVKSIISTEEMMNRQIIFLLALGRFYTQESSTPGQSGDFANVASSTLSAQLTSLLGDLSNNLQIGTNIRTNNYEEYTDTEVKLLLSSQLLNNRLLINGNLGYKDNPTEQRSFVGDFDLEYKLTKNGDIRLKAYNHYNDKYYYVKSALTTQGVGIMFRRDFDDLYDLMKIKKKVNEEPGTQTGVSTEYDNMIRFR